MSWDGWGKGVYKTSAASAHPSPTSVLAASTGGPLELSRWDPHEDSGL